MIREDRGAVPYPSDSSSIVNLVKRGVLKPLAAGVTLSITVYEAANAVWRKRFEGEKAVVMGDKELRNTAAKHVRAVSNAQTIA
ncbi:MAG: hypothetical protein QXH70_09115 [Thermofilaceae archaeon]